MRSTSDEAIHSKSEGDPDEDSIRSPYYKPKKSSGGGAGGASGGAGGGAGGNSVQGAMRYPLSPQSPPSDESSYQGSIPGSAAPSDRSYTGGGAGGSGGSGAPGATGGANLYQPSGLSSDSRESRSATGEDLEEALLRPGYYLPEYKH